MYSPFVGPVLLVALLLSSAVPEHRRAQQEGRRSQAPLLVAVALAAAIAQTALNLWIDWLGDGVIAAAVAVLLFVTRGKS